MFLLFQAFAVEIQVIGNDYVSAFLRGIHFKSLIEKYLCELLNLIYKTILILLLSSKPTSRDTNLR